MNEENKELLKQYEDLKIQEKEIKTKLDELKSSVTDIIKDNPKVITEKGSFTLGSRDTYKYSEELTNRADELKADQKVAVQTGEVEINTSQFVTYKAIKVVEE